MRKGDFFYILCDTQAIFDELDERVLNGMGWNLEDENGVPMRVKYPTEHYSEPEFHPLNGKLLFLINPNSSLISVNGTFAQGNPLEVPGLIRANERSSSRLRKAKDWKPEGFFSKDENV